MPDPYPYSSTTGQWLDTNILGGINLGYYAGVYDPTLDIIAIGYASNGAGNHNNGSIFGGRHSGFDARGADNSVMFGHAAGHYARDASQSVAIGYLAAANEAQNPNAHSFCSVAIGTNAAIHAESFQTSVLIGSGVAAEAKNAVGSVIIGNGAAYHAVAAGGSVLIGQYAGGNVPNLVNCVYLGNQAGYSYDRSNTLLIEGNSDIGKLGIGSLIYGEFDSWSRLIQFGASKMGFFGTAAITKPVVTGSRSDPTAIASLLTKLSSLGLITDSTTA